jgi:hypothetical protein
MWGTRRCSCFATCAYEKTFSRKYVYLWDLTPWPLGNDIFRFPSSWQTFLSISLKRNLFPNKIGVTIKLDSTLQYQGARRRVFVFDLTTISTAVTLLSVGWHDINKQRRRTNQSFRILEHTCCIIVLANKQLLVYLAPKGLNIINEK